MSRRGVIPVISAPLGCEKSFAPVTGAKVLSREARLVSREGSQELHFGGFEIAPAT